MLSSPLVDLKGDLYIADADQLWAFHPSGDVKWVIPIPAPLLSAAFSVDGYFCGVTSTGQVLILHRTDGSLAAPKLELPGGAGPPGQTTPPGLWTNLMDPAIIGSTFAIFFGFEADVANTPAVNPNSNRIYITAAGSTPTQGVLYGIDFTPGTPGDVHLAFAAPMGAGSATSPTISPDGSHVYAVDGAGMLYAFDANSGEEVWTAPLGRSAGAATVGPDGTLYVARAGDAVALSSDGKLLWRENYADVASRFLPPLPTPTGRLVPTASVDSLLSASANYLYLVLILGYEIVVPSSHSTFLVPKMTVLLVIDPSDGEIIAPVVFLRDTSDGILTIDSNGHLYVTHGSISSSIAYYALNPTLPPHHPLRVRKPTGGVTALGPLSFRHLAEAGIRWVQSLNATALPNLERGRIDEVLTHVDRGMAQLSVTHRTLTDAASRGEIRAEHARETQIHLNNANNRLKSVKLMMTVQRGGHYAKDKDGFLEGAKTLIRNAQFDLTRALSLVSSTSQPYPEHPS